MWIPVLLLVFSPLLGWIISSLATSRIDGRTVTTIFELALSFSALFGVPSFVLAFRAWQAGATGKAALLIAMGIFTSVIAVAATFFTFIKGGAR